MSGGYSTSEKPSLPQSMSRLSGRSAVAAQVNQNLCVAGLTGRSDDLSHRAEAVDIDEAAHVYGRARGP
jgi:hypothetical protein